MKLKEKIPRLLMRRLQRTLFPGLEECCMTPLTAQEKHLLKVLEIINTEKHIPKLPPVKFRDAKTKRALVFLTNNFSLPALTIAQPYHSSWQVELFFNRIKQHLRTKTFLGISENTVKPQIWITVSVYVLVAITKKQLNLQESLHTILQILSVSVFKKKRIFIK